MLDLTGKAFKERWLEHGDDGDDSYSLVRNNCLNLGEARAYHDIAVLIRTLNAELQPPKEEVKDDDPETQF